MTTRAESGGAVPQSPSGRLSRGVVIVGAGPVGLITALGLTSYGIPVTVLESNSRLSAETKAGTILTRTLEVLDRYGALEPVLAKALRVDEIGELERATNRRTHSIRTNLLTEDTRFPFVINIPQNELEPILADVLEQRSPGCLQMGVRATDITQAEDHVLVHTMADGRAAQYEADYVLACDGGRSTVRDLLGITVEGHTLEDRYMLVDLKVDLDIANPRDYPYLAYFSDPEEWMVLVRQPHCWRFLYRLPQGAAEPSAEELRAKALRFIGEVDEIELVGTNVYTVHHRVADRWRDGRVMLMGDAAHLITPMWALGLNTGALDASSLPWRLAWIDRGWADAEILDGYAREQAPVAIEGSGEMAEEARQSMSRRPTAGEATSVPDPTWGDAYTRTLLGVSLDIRGDGDWSMVHTGQAPNAIRVGDRIPDLPLHGPDGRPVHLHTLAREQCLAVHFLDARRRGIRPEPSAPGLRHIVVSRWDAPLDRADRSWTYFDPGERLRSRLRLAAGTSLLLRPDGHVAAMLPPREESDPVAELTEAYRRMTGLTQAPPAPVETATALDGTVVELGGVGTSVIWDSDTVRIWDVVLEDGEVHPWHLHHNPYVVLSVAGSRGRMDWLDGAAPRYVEEYPGGAVFRPVAPVHQLTNLGGTRYRNRLIELKDLGEKRADGAHDVGHGDRSVPGAETPTENDGRQLVLSTPFVRVWTLEVGASHLLHLDNVPHVLARLDADAEGAELLTAVREVPGGSRTLTAAGPSETWFVVALDYLAPEASSALDDQGATR